MALFMAMSENVLSPARQDVGYITSKRLGVLFHTCAGKDSTNSRILHADCKGTVAVTPMRIHRIAVTGVKHGRIAWKYHADSDPAMESMKQIVHAFMDLWR